MGKAVYEGVGGVARKAKNIYEGISGVARKIKAGWIGVGGIARQFWSGGGLVIYDYGNNPYSLKGSTSYVPVTLNSTYINISATDDVFITSTNMQWPLHSTVAITGLTNVDDYTEFVFVIDTHGLDLNTYYHLACGFNFDNNTNGADSNVQVSWSGGALAVDGPQTITMALTDTFKTAYKTLYESSSTGDVYFELRDYWRHQIIEMDNTSNEHYWWHKSLDIYHISLR